MACSISSVLRMSDKISAASARAAESSARWSTSVFPHPPAVGLHQYERLTGKVESVERYLGG